MAEITVMASISSDPNKPIELGVSNDAGDHAYGYLTIQEADELVTKLLDAIDEATKNEF